MSDPTSNLYSGDVLSFSYTAKDADGDPSDLTGWTAIGAVKTSDRSDTVILNLAPTIPTPANGIILVNQETNDIEAGQYVMDVRLVNDADADKYITIDRRILKIRRPVSTYTAP
jgi:hypothetical protein